MSLPVGWTALTAVAGLTGVLIWRVREGRTAVTTKKIVMPPLGMATGFSMFVVPAFRVPWLWAVLAFLAGAILLAYPLLATSRLERQGDSIMMKRSGAFFAVIVVLAIIRYAARGYLNNVMSVDQTAALFFVLAFGMILRWRMSMLMEFRALTSSAAE